MLFFSRALKDGDDKIYGMLVKELARQQNNLQLIASENFVSRAVMEAQGSCFTNKYVEGYPHKRFYSGCEVVDEVEELAIARVCKLFGCKYANVQPHSGSQANQSVFLSLLKPGDTILSLSLNSGGHLTHGAPPNMSGKWFDVVPYEVDRSTYLIDMEEVRSLAKKHNPKMIIAGASAYPRRIDFAEFRKIADEVGAYFLADIAHYAGLVAAGEYPSPLEHAHVVTSTTHKTLRGPRGGLVLSNSEEIIKKINSAVFPGLQGGAQMHGIAAKAVAFEEAMGEDYRAYIKRVIENARALSAVLVEQGFNVLTSGTDSHMILVDLRNKELKGRDTAINLEKAGIVCNKNSVPFDTESPFITSGLRFGSPAETTKGLDKEEFSYIGSLVADLIHGKRSVSEVKSEVLSMCSKFPIYPAL